MSSTIDKIRGTANQVAGSIKVGVGRVTGDRGVRAEGLAQQTEGRTQKTLGRAKDGIRNAADAIRKGF